MKKLQIFSIYTEFKGTQLRHSRMRISYWRVYEETFYTYLDLRVILNLNPHWRSYN